MYKYGMGRKVGLEDLGTPIYNGRILYNFV
jgi:hypothetical protein